MSSDVYELIALTMRYFFAGLMVLIVLRAARGAVIDSRRANKLRRLSPMTGLTGELVVLEGDQRARRGMRYPVIREGMIGSARRADIRIRHASVRHRHAYFELKEDGLHVRSHAGARLRDGKGNVQKDLILLDGDSLCIGSVKLLLVLTMPDAETSRHHAPDEKPKEDDAFDAEDAAERRAARARDAHREDERSVRESYDPDAAYRRPTESYDPDAAYRRPTESYDPDAAYRRPTESYDPDAAYRRPSAGESYDPNADDPGYGIEYTPADDTGSGGIRYTYTYNPAPQESEPVRRRGMIPDEKKHPKEDKREKSPQRKAAPKKEKERDTVKHSSDHAQKKTSKSKSSNAFPDGEDPFDVFLDGQDDDFDF